MKKETLKSATLVAVLVAAVMFIVNTLFPGALVIKPVVRGLGSIGAQTTKLMEATEAVETIAVDSICIAEEEYHEDWAAVE